jgi:hypothetical protein
MSDPLIPPWEMCKVCGGDHWTKDHPDLRLPPEKQEPMPPDRGNGLAALAAALHTARVGCYTDYRGDWACDGRAGTHGPNAAAILGERGVFLPDGVCGHEEEYLGYWRATNEALATIAALRAALDEVDARLDTLFSTAPSPQDDPESWAQGVYFAREACERALATSKGTP